MAWEIFGCGELPDVKIFKEACKIMFQKIDEMGKKPSSETRYPPYLLRVWLEPKGGDFPAAAHPSLNFWEVRLIARELKWIDKNDNWIE